ncbi:MAG: SagB/ThcOx family dehydrogenase [Nitrospinae bacterium]|nr:SagB/ThcOx family dehydrogenase [Nitrospinota bacterium]
MAKILQDNLYLTPKKKNISPSISELYNENVKLHPSTIHAVLPTVEFSNLELRAMIKGFKQYSQAKKIKLPSPNKIPGNTRTFSDVLESRKSIKDFGEEPLSLLELSKVLYQSYGAISKVEEPGVGERLQRVVPSAGGLYPAEIYLGIRNVGDLDPGIYHYNVLNHELELLEAEDPTEKVCKVCCGQIYAKEAAVVVLISAVLERTKRKYGERGYRYALLDLGHLGQNIYLSCTSLELAVMTTCGFFDDLGNELLKLDGLDETLMYVAFIGKQKF